MHPGSHISDQDLVMAADGELSPSRLAKVHSHLETCGHCRARAGDIHAAMSEFMGVRNAAGLPPMGGARAQLRARLALLAQQPLPKAVSPVWVWAGAAAAALLLAAGLSLFPGIVRQKEVATGMIPNKRLTPGAVVSTDVRSVCSGVASGGAAVIPAALGQRVFEEYGIRSPQPRAYELDYLIAPELGGSGDIRNVWPQPYSAVEWNSHLKDALEGRLHDLVCSGRVPLATAQHDIAANWVAAYKKYFQTGAPLPDHYAFAKDMPWIE